MKSCSSFIIFVFVLTSCCVQTDQSPITYHNSISIRKTIVGLSNNKTKLFDNIIDNEEHEIIGKINDHYVIPVKSLLEQSYKIIYHEVQSNELIEDIARKYHQNLEEIAHINLLCPPYYLDKSQLIKVKVLYEETKNKSLNFKDDTTQISHYNFIYPVKGELLVKFGEKTTYGISKGINIKVDKGTKVSASTSGKVIYSDYDSIFGYLVIVQLHNQNLFISYGHMNELAVSKGDTVNQGETIGYTGNTGKKVDKTQLYFSIREGRSMKNPMQFLKF